MITLSEPPSLPAVMVVSELFQSGYVAVTLQLDNPPISADVSYAVNITPPVESSVMIQGATAHLRAMYNVRYSVRVVATNCAGNSSPVITNIFYG